MKDFSKPHAVTQRSRAAAGCVWLLQASLFAAAPVVDYVTIARRPGTLLVDIEYKVTDADGDAMTIAVVGIDRQGDRVVPMTTLAGAGAAGAPVTSGVHKLVWDAGADWPENVTNHFEVRLTANDAVGQKFLLIDVSGGSAAGQYPVEFRDTLDPKVLTDVYRTGKIVLVRLAAGSYNMGSPDTELGRYSDEVRHDVVLTKPFYIGMFEITQQQWERVMGTYPSRYAAATNPVEQVGWTTVRGGEWPTGAKLPASDSFVGKLRKKTGLPLDLPTEAQWEYACRAGTVSALNNGTNLADTSSDPNLSLLGRYSGNVNDARPGDKHTNVGLYQANAWGLFDMHGNVAEWCLDWGGAYQTGTPDPEGPTSGSGRIVRGGAFSKIARWCRSAGRRDIQAPGNINSDIGFRIVTPDNVAVFPNPL